MGLTPNGGDGYDFFAPGTAGPTGPPPAPDTRTSPTAGPLGSAPPLSNGQFGAPTGFIPGLPTTGGPPPPVRRSPSGRSSPAKPFVVLGVVCALVIGALALVPKLHVPDRIHYFQTSIAIPDSVAGFTHNPDPDASAGSSPTLTSTSANAPSVGGVSLGIYNGPTGTPGLVVVAAKFKAPNIHQTKLDPAHVSDELRSAGQGTLGAFVNIPTGKLGGQILCVNAAIGIRGGRICTVEDVAVAMVLAFSDPNVSNATVLTVREAVEVRR